MNVEFLGWITTFILWASFFPKNRFYLHLVGLIASLGRLSYILILYNTTTGDLARPLIANWIVLIIIHLYSMFRFRKELKK